MSDNQFIWLLEGCVLGVGLLIALGVVVAHAISDTVCRRRNDQRIARELPHFQAVAALTLEDRRWLAAMLTTPDESWHFQ